MKRLLGGDFTRFKNVPFLHLVGIARDYMLDYWESEEGRNEQRLALQWKKTYAKDDNPVQLTRIEAWRGDPIRGGIPCDTNVAERGHRNDKMLLNYMRSGLIDFIGNTERHLSGRSSQDLDWYGVMKKKVNSTQFFSWVLKTFEQADLGIATIFWVYRDATWGGWPDADWLEPGCVIIPSYLSLKHCRKEMGKTTVDDVNQYLTEERWFEYFIAIVSDPDELLDNQPLEGHKRFNHLFDWLATLHVLFPISDTASVLEIRSMLLASEYERPQVDEPKNKEPERRLFRSG